MSEYRVVEGHVVFCKLYDDTLGENFRVAELEGKKAVRHKLMCQVNPLIAGNPDAWKRVKILLEGIRKSNIARLYSPEKILAHDGQASLVYEYFKGRNLEQILKDADQKGVSINFDLAFSMAVAIADIVELGSSIVVSGEKSFHGFLTPDNILIDIEGKIVLKNYGLLPYLEKGDAFYSQMETRYGPWLTPEFMRRERAISQSDIYHLGFILYHMLTGKYFSASGAEDFDAKFANLTFKQYIPSTDKDFLTHLINFFKRTLHPDPLKRFLSIKEFKEYISSYFHIEELSSITFNLAYFMNSLYGEMAEEEEKTLQEELAYVIPEPKKERPAAPFASSKPDSEIVSNILQGLDQEKKSKKWIWGVVGIAVLAGAFSIFMYLSGVSAKKSAAAQAEAERVRAQQEIQRQEAQQKLLQSQLEEKLKASEQAKTDLENQIKKTKDDAERQRLLQQKQEADKKAAEDKKALEEMQQKQAEEEKRKLEEAENQRKAQEELEKQKVAEAAKIAEQQRVKEGDTVAVSDLTVKPERISGQPPMVNRSVSTKYKGKNMTALISILVDENGAVTKWKMLSTVQDDLRSLIEDALKTWKYKPAQKDGVKVKVWLTVPMRFDF